MSQLKEIREHIVVDIKEVVEGNKETILEAYEKVMLYEEFDRHQFFYCVWLRSRYDKVNHLRDNIAKRHIFWQKLRLAVKGKQSFSSSDPLKLHDFFIRL